MIQPVATESGLSEKNEVNRNVLSFALIIVVWLALYIPNLRTSPPWYSDECIALDIAKNLTQGKLAYSAQWNTFLTIVFQPVYEGWVAFWLFVGGQDIGLARMANAVIALGIALVIFSTARRVLTISSQNSFSTSRLRRPDAVMGIALGGALIFLSAGPSILHFRMILPHNGVAFGTTLAALSACLAASRSSDAMIGLGNLIAVGSHPLGLFGALGASVRRLPKPRSWFLAAILPACVFLLLYAAPLSKFGEWVLQDANIIFESYGEYSEEHKSSLFQNILQFFSFDIFHILGFLGALLLPVFPSTRRLWPITTVFVVFCMVLFSNRSNLTVFYYQAVVLLPGMAIGAAAFVSFLGTCLSRWVPRMTLFLPCTYGLVVTLVSLPTVWTGQLQNRNHYWATQDFREVEDAASWINGQLGPEDLVIANPNIAWLLDCRHASLLQLTAWHGHKTFMHEKGTLKERFRFDLDTSKIRYLVLGDIDQRWGVGQPNVQETLKSEGLLDWPLVWRGRYYLILENPSTPSVTN